MIQPAKSLLSPEEIVRFEALLIEQRKALRESLDRLHSHAIQDNPENMGETVAKTHLADIGTELFDQEADLGLAEQISRSSQEVDRAMERLISGRYGICETCGDPIPVARLEAIPWAARCTRCQSQIEQGVDLS